MKYLILICMIVSSCGHSISTKTAENSPAEATGNNASPAVDIPYTVARHYFVNNGFKREAHPNAKITTQKEFDEVFGMATVMGTKPTPVDFSTQYVLSVIGEPTDKRVEITPFSLKQQQGTIVFNYNITTGEQRSVTIQPVLIIIVNKDYIGEIKLVCN